VQTGQTQTGSANPVVFQKHIHKFLLKIGNAIEAILERNVSTLLIRNTTRRVRQSSLVKRKGCDIGYALATGSCEEANSVEARTVAALDVITAFAVPNPNCPSQDQSVFSGLVAPQVALPSLSLSLLRTGFFNFANPFSRRREST
jgi:hypothetical protein